MGLKLELRGPGVKTMERRQGEAKHRNESGQGQRPLGRVRGRTRDVERVKEEKALPEGQS